MVGKLHGRDLKPIHFDLGTVQYEIEFFARAVAGIRRQAAGIGIAQARGLHEQIELVVAPVGIEIAGDDDRFGGLAHQIVQIPQLVLSVPKLQ